MRERFDWLVDDATHRRRNLRAVEAAVNRRQLGADDRPALLDALVDLEAGGGLTDRERHRVLRVRIALADGPAAKGAVFSAFYLPGGSGSPKSR
jgi:hypothetical protein